MTLKESVILNRYQKYDTYLLKYQNFDIFQSIVQALKCSYDFKS